MYKGYNQILDIWSIKPWDSLLCFAVLWCAEHVCCLVCLGKALMNVEVQCCLDL